MKTKIFVINLDKDRNRYLSTYNWQRIPAIYGKNLSASELSKYGNKLSNSEIGCYLSHLQALRAIIDQDLPYAVILEDDVTLTDWFPKLDVIIRSLPNTFDICWIGNSRALWPRNTCNMIPDYDYERIYDSKINNVYKIDDKYRKSNNYPMSAY